jgi:predicted lipoprotein with Yx(FWY)xxD motif
LLVALLLVTSPVLAQTEEPAAGSTTLVSLGSTEALGQFLVGENGMTLYSFTPDPLDETVCYDDCAEAWPPLLVDNADELTVAEGIPGEFGTIKRKDDTLQVTYNGIPLYYWFRDEKAGDTTGQFVGNIWWVVPPATVYNQRVAKLGSVLVGPTGMTLYKFDKDTANTSNCYDKCAENWPPLTVESADALIGTPNIPGEFGTTERKDGKLQATYNGMPLYYWKDDKKRGDTLGEAVGDIWWTVVPGTVALGKADEVGDFLVATGGKTLYTFTKDTEGVSNCADECAKNWPPYTLLEDERLAAGAGITGKLDLIKRADGKMQVTYKGMPLYFFKDDKKPGDTAGHEVGEVWFAAKP